VTIGFDQIALQINTPGQFVEFDNTRAVQGVGLAPHDVLIAGQRIGGTATAGQIYSVGSDAEAIALFGATSQLRQMIAAYKAYDSLSSVYAVASAVDAGTNAAGSFVWTGPATEAGELVLYVGGRRVSVPVANGDSAATIETNALAAFALVANDLPVVVSANAGTGVDLTAVQDGTIGNSIMLGVCLMPGERAPAGVVVTTTPMAAGATNPSYAGVITAMGEDQYATIVSGLADATVLGLFITELESRWGPMRAIEGQVFAAAYDTRANLTTLGNSFNSFAATIVGAEKSALLPTPWELAAQAAAISARQAQVDPSRAMTGIAFSGFSGAHRGARFTRAERDILLSDGISTVKTGDDGRLRVERLITTWQTNAQALPDKSYYDLTTVRLLAALRFSVRSRISSKFDRYKLTDDATPIPAGQPIVNPAILKAEMIVLFQDWMDLGWVQGLDQFKSELVVEPDVDPNRVNMILPPDLINNLLVTAAKISFKR
jgi:phage tail sheath gpL-like